MVKRCNKYKDFEKFTIQYDLLQFESTLLIRYKTSHGPIKGYENKMIISQLLSEILLNIINDEFILIDCEKLLYDQLLIMEDILRKSNMISKIEYKRPKREILTNQIRKRLTVIQGSILAGAENDLIAKDALEMVTLLFQYGDLSEKHYYKLKTSLE